MSKSELPEYLYAAYEWINCAGEWDEALADPKYAKQAYKNAIEHDVRDVTESDLADVIAWCRRYGI